MRFLSSTAVPALALLLAQFPAHAQEGPWLIRARAVYLNPANSDDTGLNLSINKKVLPELDITYFITPQWATELILTYPQKHSIRAGDTSIGSLKHLPPTLTLQYHFAHESVVRPYVGAGVNYTRMTSVDLPSGVTVKRDSVGPAIQAGFDVPLSGNVVLNVDVKKVQIKTKVYATGSSLGSFHVDPLLFGVGIGWRF